MSDRIDVPQLRDVVIPAIAVLYVLISFAGFVVLWNTRR
jgi:hypothetical protein